MTPGQVQAWAVLRLASLVIGAVGLSVLLVLMLIVLVA